MVNYATNAFARCDTSASGKDDEDLAVLMLYLQVIEMTDGVEVVLSQSCTGPAIPLLRSSFEALLSMEYILEKDYARRSHSWLADYAYMRLAAYEKADPSTPKGKDFQRDISLDRAGKYLSLPDIGAVDRAKDNLEKFLSKPHLSPVVSEFSKFKRRPHWYQLFGGPSNLRELARRLERHAQYEILYRYYSTAVHGHDMRFLQVTEHGGSALFLRDTAPLAHIAGMAASWMLSATRLMLGKFRPGEDISTLVQERGARAFPFFEQGGMRRNPIGLYLLNYHSISRSKPAALALS